MKPDFTWDHFRTWGENMIIKKERNFIKRHARQSVDIVDKKFNVKSGRLEFTDLEIAFSLDTGIIVDGIYSHTGMITDLDQREFPKIGDMKKIKRTILFDMPLTKTELEDASVFYETRRNFHLDGCCINYEHQEIVSCDGHGLMMQKKKFFLSNVNGDNDLLIDGRTFVKFMSAFNLNGITKIDVSETLMKVYFDDPNDRNVVAHARIVDQKFPNYRAVVPETNGLKSIVLTDEFKKIIGKLKPSDSDKIILTENDSKLRIVSKFKDADNWFYVDTDVDIEKSFQMMFTLDLLKKAIQKKSFVFYKTADDPIVTDSDNGLQAVLMPRADSEDASKYFDGMIDGKHLI